ncbi:MAG: hypothetical protein ACK5V3_17980, partial [Bdellovibrionales bacterium]
LLINQKTWVWASLVESQKKTMFSLSHGKKAWLHVGLGDVTINGKKLTKGDGLSLGLNETLEIQGVAQESDLILIELE